MIAKVPNQSAPLGDVRPGAKGYLQAFITNPWSNLFQSFTQAAPAAVSLIASGSPYRFTANEPGTLFVTGGTISNISLMRGQTTINLTGQRQIPIGIGDTVSITYSVAPTLQFLGA